MKTPKLIKIFAALGYPALMLEAMDLVSKQKYTEAMTRMTKAYRLFDFPMPSTRMALEANILLSLITFRTGDFDLSIESSRVALEQLARLGSKLGEQNKNYMANYCSTLLIYCAESKERGSSEGQFPMVDVDLSAVRTDLKRKFPWTPRAAIDNGSQVACP